ncbi:hypothetical protein AADZ86_01615 [Colwelliaceae bacterium BS250]
MELIVGKDVSKLTYTESDFNAFQHTLYQQLEQLKSVLNQPMFGDEPMQFGAELEMYLVDEQGNVSMSNQLLLEQLNDPQYQPELNQYNLELNLLPVAQQGTPFTNIHNELQQKTQVLEKLAQQHNINIIPIGILPTLKAHNLNADHMTNLGRYHCLAKHLFEQRGDDFKVNINGEEPISISFKDICAEGANTSFQVHMMTTPEKFNNVFNAAQLTAPLVTAVAANSPIFLGHRLWDETRIALFKQSLDIRHRESHEWQQPTRVNFGFGWLRHSVMELFSEAVALYPPLLPVVMKKKSHGKNPVLDELSLHMGTLWPWHRPVYDHHNNAHMRIEFRAIPAGPTHLDMVANAAFAIGLANGLSDTVEAIMAVMPFRFAEYNFYRAAQYSLDANILWPLTNKHHPEEVPIEQVITKMLPVAEQGLLDLGIEKTEIDKYLGVIKKRVTEKMNGAIWQKQTQKYLEQQYSKEQASEILVNMYIKNCRTDKSITTWDQIWL